MARFVYTSKEAKDEGVHGPQDLPKLINKAIELARVPISKFKVGVVGLTNDGSVFLGVNIEFPNLPLHHSIHSEQFLLTNLVLTINEDHFPVNDFEDIHELTHIAVSADGTKFGSPCGHCLQFYQELGNPPQTKILIREPEKDINEFKSIESLIPKRFSPHNILPKDASLLLEKRYNSLVLSDLEETYPNYPALAWTALEAANKSYAPYSESPSGVVLLTCRKRLHAGWYIESVAYNPSVGPVQAALVDLVARGDDTKFNEITKVVLVEMKDAKVRQEATTEILLNQIAPNCDFKVFHCHKEPKKD